MQKIYKFSFQRPKNRKLFWGYVKTENFLTWFFDNSPYGVRVRSYVESNLKDCWMLKDFTPKFNVFLGKSGAEIKKAISLKKAEERKIAKVLKSAKKVRRGCQCCGPNDICEYQ